ncbi:lonely Cys domain-containing protein [Streptomyces sp. NPDC088746]|uniref:lonely Cys domain-containing protein n=1 Tax=Streptomyces sp. NPDC088746 TaxID=3365885 RepID=UPI00381CD556
MQEINFPEDVRKMLWILLGEMPLQARENLAWDSRALYLDLGKRVLELRDAVQESVQNAGRALPEDVARGYVQGLSLLTDDGGINRLQELVRQLDVMADGQIDYSMKIQESKWEIIAEIVMLLIELAFLAAMAFFTGGTSISQMALARARSRLALLMIIDRLLRMTHIAPALSEAFAEAIQTLAVKLAQIAFNPPGRKPDGIDWGDVGKAAAFGALGGLFESVGGYFSNKFKNWLNNGGDYFDNLDFPDFPNNNPFVSKVLNDVYDVPAVFVVSGLSESLAEVLVNGLFDGNWEFKWETFVGAGTSGVFGMYAESAVGGGALWLNNKFFAPPVSPDSLNDLPGAGGSGGGDGATRTVPAPVSTTGSGLGSGPGPGLVPGTGTGPGSVAGSAPPLTTTPPLTTPPLTTTPLVSTPPTTTPLASTPPSSSPNVTSSPNVAPSSNVTPPVVVPPLISSSLPTALTPGILAGPKSVPSSGALPSGSSLQGSALSSQPTPLDTDLDTDLTPELMRSSDDEATSRDATTQPSSSSQPPAGRGAAAGTPDQRPATVTETETDGEGTQTGLGDESQGSSAAAPHLPASSSPAAPQASSPPAARPLAGTDQTNPVEESASEESTGSGASNVGGTPAVGGAPNVGGAPAVGGTPTGSAAPPTSSSGVPTASSPQQEDLPGAPGPDADLATGRPEVVGASGPTTGATVGAPGSPAWEAARAGAEPVPRSHTWVDPVSAPPDPQQPGQTTQFAVKSKFDVRRFELDGEQVTDLTVKVGVGSPDRMPEGVWEKVLSGVEAALNAPGHRLPNGDLLHVTVERVESDPHPNGLNVGFIGRDRQMTRSAWWADADPVDYAHEITHMLGLRDESRHAVAPHRPDVEGSLLGDYRRPAPEGLAQGGLRGRHLQLISTLVGDLTPARPETAGATPARSETAGATPAPAPAPATATARQSAAPPVRRPATTGGGPGGALGAEPYAPVLPTTRPPVLDRELPRPLGGRRDRADFGNGSRMPAYIDDVQELLQDAPPEVLLELVSGGVTFGHSDVVLRGTGQALAEIGRLLSAGTDTVRPARPKKGRPTGSSLMDDVTYAFTHEPKTLAGDGRVFPYTAQDGSARKLSVTARHYGDWEQFTDTYGSPVKVDGMHRSVVTAGQSKTMQSAVQIALGGPIGPVGAAAFSGFGRIGLRLGFTDRVGYGQTEQGTSQTETRALDGSRVYLDHVYYDLRVTDAEGRIVTGPEPAVFGFAVRDGLSVRLPDSVTSTTATPGRIPRSMELGRQSAYRLVRTEGFGPVSRMRDWAAQEIGVAPGSTAYGELNSFFSSLSFQRQSPALSRGRVTTVPLFADDKARTPLGVFVVDVVPGRATLITETPDAEMRDINTLTVRNDRSVQKTAALGIDGVAGPAFNFFDLGNGTLNLRLQFGGAFRYLFSVSRTAGLGGSGAVKTAGQVKGDATGLYLVRKTVYVQRSGTGTRPQRFHTWSVDRMTRTEARRLAGWDDGLRRALRAGAPEPFAPAYLTPDRPPTLGMHRVEEFAFSDGTKTGPAGVTGQERTLLDTFADQVLTALAATYPGLVARLDQLAPPEHRTWRERAHALLDRPDPSAVARPAPMRWRNDDEYRTALANTLEVLSALSHRSMAGNLEALTTTGIRIRFNEPGRIGQGHRYIWLHGELTNRRFEGVQDDFKLRYSSVGVERVDGQKSAKRIGEAGVEGLLAFRDPMTDDIGAPHNSGGPSAGVRWGWQNDEETSFGATATYEPMTVSAGPSHLYRYDLSLTVDRGGYWRFRGLLRGAATLGLLGTQPFVFSRPQDLLIGTAPGGRRVGGGPLAAQVLISIPGTHAPAVDPHHHGAANPYASVALQPVRTLRPDRARALALGDLSRPGSLVRATDLVGEPGPVTADGRGSKMFRDLQNHPFLTIDVVPSPALVAALGQTMTSGSGGAWQLTEEGAPTREAVLRAFQPQYLTANFDQSSGPLGWSASGLMGKGPYATLWATFRHLTAVNGIQALTGSVPMDTEMVLGGTGQTAGKLTKTRTFFVGGQLVYARSHAAGPGLLGTYGLVASPWSTADQSSRTVTRSFVHDMNRKGFGHQVLVSGTAEHWLALTSSLLGSGAAGRPLVPDWIAAAAGRMTTVPGGWLAHVPEKSAHLVGLIDDGMGEVPRYTRHRWSPQSWLREENFGTYAVNALDPTTALAAFEQQVAALGLDDAGSERVRTLVSSRVLRSLDKETTGSGSSVPARTGAWGWHTLRLGKRQVRIRVQLEPGTPTFEMLDHSVEMEENRRAIETVTEGAESTKGADFGYLVGEAVHTENTTGAVAGGPTFTETGSGRKSSGESRTESTLTVFRAASTEPYAEIATPYTLRITLEADDPAPGDRGAVRKGFDRFRGKQVISVAHSAGTLREHVPLSLMAPDAEPGADLLPPPDLTGLAAPRQGISPYVLGPDTLHGDGTLKPFRFPATGFDVRRIVGLAEIQVANTYALALSYDAGFSMDGPDAARRARDTGLTRLGTGSAQALEDGSGNAALTAYYHRAVTPQGYGIPGLTEKNIAATESAQLELYAKPDFSRARLLTVADGKKMEMLRRTGVGAASSVGRENVQDSALGAGVLISSDKTGLHQIGGSGTGPYAAEGDALPTSADQLTSINTKPKTGRVFLFAVPTSWLSVADVRRGIKDTPVGRFVGGTFGRVRPGPKAVGSEAYALTWIRDDVARDLGLIDDTNFPAQVGAAWDAVGKASKAWVDADKAYWKKRRSATGLREERDAAQVVLDDAETAAGAAGRRLSRAYDVAEAAHRAVDAAEERLDGVRRAGQRDVREAQEVLDAAEAADTGEAAHDGWAELIREQIAEARTALAAAERAARERVAAAQVRTVTPRERAVAADRRVTAAEKDVATADSRVGAATRRRDAAATAFGNRRALLDTLRTTAEDAAAEYHRVRSATDQLTRWHQEAATAEGRERLAGRAEPPAVTYRKPAAVPPPPASPAPPAYTRAGTGTDARLTSPDHVTYALHDVPEDGDAFLHALVEGLSRSAPHLLTEQGVDLGDRRAAADAVLRMLTARLMDPSDADLLDAVAPDVTDAFSDAEATGAGLRGTGPLGAGTPGGREFDGLGGLMPHSVTPDRAARAALAVAQLTRPGNTEGEAGWNHGAADLLPVLAARTFGVDITVVDEAGRFQDFGPGPSDPTGHLAGSLDALPEGPRPRVVLSLADRHYQLAVPEPVMTETPKPGPKPEPKPEPEPKPQSEPEPEPKPKPKSEPEQAPKPEPEQRPADAAKGRPVRVPGTGACLFLSFMASDPGYVRSRLPGLAKSHPAVYAWLDDAGTVRRELSSRAEVRSTSGYYPGGPETAVVDAMRTAVEDYLTGSEGRLPPSVIGQLRLSGVAEFGSRIARLHRAQLVPLLAHHGVDADTLVDGSEAGLRTELALLYPTSDAPLDTAEMHTVLDAVSRWEDRYLTDVGEVFLPLLAHTFEARVEVAWNGRLADTRRAGPGDASRVVEVHYNGVDHYDGSSAEPMDLLVFGESVAPKRVKPEERDSEGDVRVNPLWTPLDEVDPDLLITANPDAVWIYTVTGDGRVLLGSEQPSAILTQEQFDALLDGMRRETPDLTADQLRRDLDGLGHTGIAARFGESGRSEPGMSRVSGEFLWSKELKRWTVNDKSGRYMSESVRPGLDPDVAAGWLREVARLFTERLGVRVVPEQVKTASAAPADPPAPPVVVPVKGMVSLAELDAIGVTLSLAQSTQAAILGDRLPVDELGLTPEQHRLIRVQRGEPDTTATTRLLLASPEPSSPEGSVDSLDMILDWEDGDEGDSLDVEPDHHQILEDLYGPGIDAAPLYPALRETLVRLDTLRRAVAASPLRDGPFDLDEVTRYVLGLGEQAPVTKAQRGELFRVALDENVEGATSLAGLAAFRLMLDGVFSVARTLPRTGGSRGRNWTGGRIRDLDTARAVGAAQQPYGEPPLGDTDPAPYVVLAAEGGHDHVVVLDGGGTPHRVTTEVFAELLALDPVLAGLPDDTPVVLLVPEAGARGLDLPRAVADRTGRKTWATSGRLRFTPQTEGGPAAVSPEHRPGETAGAWSVSEPGKVLGPDDLRDAPAWESEVVSYTQVAEGRSIGRFVFHPAEAARVEGLMRQMPAATELWHQDPVTGVLTKDPDPVPWAGRPAYFFAVHGFPGMTDMALEDGTSHIVRSTATGAFLKRRPSVARLSDDHVIVMDECWHATAGGPDFVNGDAPLMPYVADPLATVSDAQHTANETGRTVFASTRPSGIQRLSAEQGGGYVRILSTDPRGRRGRWLEFRPEPSGAALDEVARAAGLHQDDGPAPPAVRDATLRLVRALRTAFGADVDQDADYPRLLAGIGALETMRGRDPWLAGATPFTMDLLDQAVREIRGPLPDGPPDGAALGAEDYRAALLHTAAAPGTDAALTAFVPLPLLVEAARRLGGFDGPGALDAEAARVLRLPDGAGVGPAQRARLFWATAAALAWEHRTPDPDGEGARILHLERPDPARRDELIGLVAMAAAAGRGLDNPAALAAFHLEVLGALAPETRLLGADGTAAGRTWFPSARTPGPLNTGVLVTAVPKPGGGHQPGGVEPAPWKTPGSPDPYVVWAPGNSGHLLMSLPGSPVLRVPYDEVGELLSHDRELVGKPLRTDLVLAVREAGAAAGADPRDTVSALTGRGVWTTTDKVFLTGNAAPGSPYVVVSLKDPPAPGGPSAAGSWSRVRPGDSTRPEPGTTVPHTGEPGLMLTPDSAPGTPDVERPAAE